MKLREPGTFEHAMIKIMAVLSAEGAARTVGRTAKQIYNWSDPDDPALPTIEQAKCLDVMFRKATGEEPPLAKAYTEQFLAETGEGPAHKPQDAFTRLRQVVKECHEAAEAYAAYHQDGPCDRRRTEALHEIDEAVAELQQAKRDLAPLRPVA